MGVKECYTGCAERAESRAGLGTIALLACFVVVCGCMLASILVALLSSLTSLVVFIVSRV